MGRSRGFIQSWQPRKPAQAKLKAVQEVFTEYADYLPITIRQIYYRLVGRGIIGKTEREYQNLQELIGRARRAELIPMSYIRDGGLYGGLGTRIGNVTEEEFKCEVIQMATDYRTDRQAGQDRRLVLWCEAAGMIEQLKAVGDKYGVPVKSSGKFDSLTTKHGIGKGFHEHTMTWSNRLGQPS